MDKSTTSGSPGKENNISDKSDRDLLKQLVHGTDTEAARAFTEIDNRYRDSLTQYAVGYCGASEDVAEDCTQNVLLKIWQKRKELNPETIKLANYLHKAVQNEVRQVQRRDKMVEEKDQILMGSASSMPRSTPSADKELEAKETLIVINRAISKLPDGVRIPFLFRLRKMSYKEIAALLGIKPESAERQIMVARKAIKMALASAMALLVMSGTALITRGWIIHWEVGQGPQYMDWPPDVFEELVVEDWRKEHAKWLVADSLWRDSVKRGLVDSATSKRPIRPAKPLLPQPDPEFSAFDKAALKVYGKVDEIRRELVEPFRPPFRK